MAARKSNRKSRTSSFVRNYRAAVKVASSPRAKNIYGCAILGTGMGFCAALGVKGAVALAEAL